MRSREIDLNSDGKSVTQEIEPGKVKVTEAVEHDFIILETAKGKVAKIKYSEGELF